MSNPKNALEALSELTVVVADTGELDAIERWKPRDATTNPSLILKVKDEPAYADTVAEALDAAQRGAAGEAARTQDFIDRLFVGVGRLVLERIDGRVSTEVPARLSFDTEASIARGKRLIALYEEAGVDRERVLIKLATTWEGVRAAEALESEGIHCNMTLLFSLVQAVAAAEARATLISPFVGRIYDWARKDRGVKDIPIAEDPGVESVREIFTYLKHFGSPMEVMGASFRKADQVLALAGCDLLTISPELLEEIAGRDASEVKRRLDADAAQRASIERVPTDEASFRWLLNEDAMATEKLAEGIRRFHADGLELERLAAREVSTES
jgi:transaldolase